MAGSSALAVASLEAGAMMRLTIIARTRSRGRLGSSRVLRPEQPVQTDGARRAQHRGDGAVRQRALDGEGLLARRQHDPALEHAAQALDVLGRPMAEVEQRALADALAVPIALAQQDGGRGAAVGDGFDIHGRRIAETPRTINKNIRFTWLHFHPSPAPKMRKIRGLTLAKERSSG